MFTTSKTQSIYAIGAMLFIGMFFFVLPHTALAQAAGGTNPLIVTPGVSTGSSTQFISLTNFPLFSKGATDAAGMHTFLNLLYQYLIGIAVILAVLEILWGGFLWMGSGASVTSKESGKNKITMALAGLLLVLSPYIVFQIINPHALSLQLGTNLSLNIPTPKATPKPVAGRSSCTSSSGSILKSETCLITKKFTEAAARNKLNTWLTNTCSVSQQQRIQCVSNKSSPLVITDKCAVIVASCSTPSGTFNMDYTYPLNLSKKYILLAKYYQPLVLASVNIAGINVCKDAGGGNSCDTAISFTNACIKQGGEYCVNSVVKAVCPEKGVVNCANVTYACKLRPVTSGFITSNPGSCSNVSLPAPI